MIDFHQNFKKRLIVVFFLSILLLLNGCDSGEESQEHLQKGVEYLDKGEYEKAKLEIKSASQSGKETAETYYYMALLDEKNRQFKGMKENLIKTIELAPNFTEARLKLGKVQLLFGETKEAMEQAEYVLKDASRNSEALALKASILIRQKKQTEALAIIDNILKEKPNHTDALSLKAVIYMEKEDYNQALALIDAAKKSDSKNIGLDFFKIQLDAKTKNVNAVINDYQQLITSHPEKQEFKVTLAKIYAQTGKLKEAEQLLSVMVDSEPNNVQPKLLLLDFFTATAKEKVNDQFFQFTQKHKDQPRMLLQLANWMVARRSFEEAKSALNRVIELEEDSNVGLSAKTLLAKIAFDNKDFEGSQQIVNEILESNSSYDDAKVMQARLLLIKEQYDEAIALLNKVVWSKEESEEAQLLIGQALLIKGDKKQAEKHFSNALAVNPANLQAVTYLYDDALRTKNIKYAKEIIEKALSIKPDNIALLEKLANVNLAENDWDGAKVTVQKIANLPIPLANDVASYLLAQVLQGQGDYANAIKIYKELLLKYPENSDALGNMARSYEKLNKREDMISFLDTLLEKNPRNISAGILQSDLLLMDNKFDKGTLVLTNMLKENAKIPLLYISLAKIKLAENDKKAAMVYYQNGLKHNPGNIKLSLSLASLYEAEGEYDSAVLLYEELLSKNPELDIAINNLATVLTEHYTDDNKLKKAVQLTEKFKDSDQTYYKDTYAWALVKYGNVSEGLRILNQITATSPDVPVFRYHLGVAHFKNGNTGSAFSEIKQALELEKESGNFPNKKEAEKLLEEIASKTRGN